MLWLLDEYTESPEYVAVITCCELPVPGPGVIATEQLEELPPVGVRVQLPEAKSALNSTEPAGGFEGPGPLPFTTTVQVVG